MYIDLLPVGTVVELEGSEGKVIIAGYAGVGSEGAAHVWDYVGFIFPRGYFAADAVLQFDRENIARVVAMGYQDEEQFEFIEKLDAAMDDLKQSAMDMDEK